MTDDPLTPAGIACITSTLCNHHYKHYDHDFISLSLILIQPNSFHLKECHCAVFPCRLILQGGNLIEFITAIFCWILTPGCTTLPAARCNPWVQRCSLRCLPLPTEARITTPLLSAYCALCALCRGRGCMAWGSFRAVFGCESSPISRNVRTLVSQLVSQLVSKCNKAPSKAQYGPVRVSKAQ